MRALGVVAALVVASMDGCVPEPAVAHDQWANGEPVPSWVKLACCGPDDVHHLRPDQVRIQGENYIVEGYPSPIPVSAAQPSPDGEYWIFYRTLANGDKTRVYCFFIPPGAV